MKRYASIFLLFALTLGCFGQIQLLVNSVGSLPIAVSGSYVIANAETLTYSNNIYVFGGTISNQDLVTVDKFVTSEKATGNWVWDVDCSPFAGNNTNAAVVKLKSGNTTTNLALGGGMAATDWNKLSGWNNPGARYLDTRFTNTIPSMCFSNGMEVWIVYPPTNLVINLAGWYAGIVNAGLIHLLAQNSAYTPANMLSGNLNTVSPGSYGPFWGSGAGLFGYTQVATNFTESFQNGMVNQVNTTATTTNLASGSQGFKASMYLFGRDNVFAGVSGSLTNNPLGWYCIDSGRPTNLIASHWTNVLRLMVGLGRGQNYKSGDEDGVMIGGQSLATGGGNNTVANPLPAFQTNQSPWLLYAGGEPIPTQNSGVNGGSGNLGANNTITGYSEQGTSIDGWGAFGAELHWEKLTNSVTDNTTFFGNFAWAGMGIMALQQGSGTNMYFTNNSTYYPTVSTATNLFESSMVWFQNAQANWTNLYGVNLAMKAIIWVHGETDRALTTYETNLEYLDKAYWTRMNAINGKTGVIPLMAFEESSFFWPNSASLFPYSDMGMVRAMENNYPSNTIIGTRYMMQFASDNIHLGNRTFYQWQAEYAAEAYYHWVHDGWWQPTWPTNCVRSGTTMTWTCARTNLVLDTNLVITVPNYGFTYSNSLGQTAISSVFINGGLSNQVNVVLGADPAAATWATLYYAMNNVAGGTPGNTAGARGNIRDQYQDTGFCTTSNLYNWMIHIQDTNANSTSAHMPAL